MPYGISSNETMIALRERGLTPCEADDVEDAEARIDIVVYGALDESFYVTDLFHYTQIVDAIADTLKHNSELGGEWEVDAYHPNEELCERLYYRMGEAYT